MKKVKLSATDRKLVALLQQDGRLALNALARQLRISRQTASHRVRALQQSTVIRRCYAVLDYPSLGLIECSALLTVAHEQETPVLDALADDPAVRWVGLLLYDQRIRVNVLVQTIHEFNEWLGRLSEKIGAPVHAVRTAVDLRILKNAVGLQHRVPSEPTVWEPDEHDARMIGALLDDGRATLTELATQAQLSVEAARQRKHHLESAGTIRAYTISVNPLLAGLQVEGILYVQLTSPGKSLLGRIQRYICNEPLYGRSYACVGEWHVEISILGPDVYVVEETLAAFRSAFQADIRSSSFAFVIGTKRALKTSAKVQAVLAHRRTNNSS